MGLPTKVKIAGKVYDVEHDAEVIDPDTGQRLMGRIQGTKDQILLSERLEGNYAKAEILLHEIFHGISWDRDLNLDERQVDQLACGVLALFDDNPELFGTTYMDTWTKS